MVISSKHFLHMPWQHSSFDMYKLLFQSFISIWIRRNLIVHSVCGVIISEIDFCPRILSSHESAFCKNKNIVRHTAHTIVSWPNPKQWLMIHTSGLIMIIRLSTHSVWKIHLSWLHRPADVFHTMSEWWSRLWNKDHRYRYSDSHYKYKTILMSQPFRWKWFLVISTNNMTYKC